MSRKFWRVRYRSSIDDGAPVVSGLVSRPSDWSLDDVWEGWLLATAESSDPDWNLLAVEPAHRDG